MSEIYITETIAALQNLLTEQRVELAALTEQLDRQRNELAGIKGSIPTQLPGPNRSPKDVRAGGTTRRKLLRRLAMGGMVASGALVAGTLGATGEAEARFISNFGGNRIGAVVLPPGAPNPVNLPPGNVSNTYGLVASSSTGTLDLNTINNSPTGVYGTTGLGSGVYGNSTGGASGGVGVYGKTTSPVGAGVAAEGSSNTITALSIVTGAFQVLGAAIDTHTTAFIHHTTAASISANQSVIDHPLTNGHPDVLLIITHNYNPVDRVGSPAVHNQPVGVFYNPNNRWCIYNEDINVAMPQNMYFNVLVIRP